MAKNLHKPTKKTKTGKHPTNDAILEPTTAGNAADTSVPVSAPVSAPSKLPNSWRIARRAVDVLLQNWKVFLGITLIYTLLTVSLVQGFAAGDNVTDLKQMLEDGFGGQLGKLVGGTSVFLLLVASSGNSSSDVAGVYQTFLTIIASLAIIWALRQVLAGRAGVRIRDAFYLGMYPLIPVVLVLLAIVVQLVPFIVGAAVYSLVISSGIAASTVEIVLWGVLFFLCTALTLFLLTSSIFALYIAALPDMTPIKALRSAFGLVRGRRWSVLRKLLLLPLILIVAAAVVMLPIIYLVTPLAPWAFFLLTMVGLPVIHAYLYTLYRELLV